MVAGNLKNYLLKDPKIKLYITEQFQHFITREVKPRLLLGQSLRAWYLIHGASEKNSERLELENKLTDLQKKYHANPSNELRLQLDATKTALETILTAEAQKSLLFCKQRMYEYGNKPSRYLARRQTCQ